MIVKERMRELDLFSFQNKNLKAGVIVVHSYIVG